MAAPTATARGTPAGIKLRDGYSSKITFARFTTVKFWEKTVQPAGYDGGDKIDQTTMHNADYKTFSPQALTEITDGQTTVAYDPHVLTQIIEMINIEDTITYTYSDGSTAAFYGYLKSFEPAALTPGEQPEATITIVHTAWDPANDAEAGGTITQVSGT